MMRRALAVALALVVAAGVATGCGSDRMSKSQYITEMKQIIAQYAKDVDGKIDMKKTPSIDGMLAASRALDRAADSMDKLKPPLNVDRTHRKFIRAIRGMAKLIRTDLLRQVKAAKGDQARIVGIFTAAFSHWSMVDADEVTHSYDRHGYSAITRALVKASKS